MAHGEHVIAERGEGEDAGHAIPLGIQRRPFDDALVGEQNGVSNTGGRRRIVDAHALSNRVGGECGSDVAADMAADAIDDQHELGLRIQLVSIFIFFAATAGMTAGRGRESCRPEGKRSRRVQARGVSHAGLLRS